MYTVLLLVSALFLISLHSCGKEEMEPQPSASERQTAETEDTVPETAAETAELPPVEKPALTQGIIAFLSGDVLLRDGGGEWIYADIGDHVGETDSIRVETASYCEIQFSDTALIRIEEDTELSMSSIGIENEGSQVGVAMNRGSVLCKVKKLGGNDEFEIKTKTAVCGVRGTQFSVSATEEGDTVLAVKEGAVAVLPSTLDLDNLKGRIGTENASLLEILDQLEDSAPVVGADQELDLTRETLEATRASAALVTETVEKILAEGAAGAAAPEKLEELTRAVEQTKEEIVKKVEQPRKVSIEKRSELEKLDSMEMLDFSGEDSAGEESGPQLYTIVIQTRPAEADISMNGKNVGTGKYSAIFKEGKELSFTISAAGYTARSLAVTLTEETAKKYTVELPRIEPAEKPEAEKASAESGEVSARKENSAAEEKPARPVHTVTVTAEPTTASIILNGKQVGTGSYETEAEEGTDLVFTVQQRGYTPETVDISVADQPVERQVTLTVMPLEIDIPVSGTGLRGEVTLLNGMVLSADGNGVVTAASLNGTILWRAATANAPNENSFPVAAGNSVYFSGAKELVIMNAANGAVTGRVPLDSNSAHIFGRRVTAAHGQVYFPANDSIRILDPVSGATVREIAVPRGSKMTPALWNNRLVIADQQGFLLIINPGVKSPVEAEIATRAVQPVTMAPTLIGDRAVFSGRRGTVVCVDLAKRSVLWEKKLPGSTSVFSDIVSNGNGLYVWSRGTLFALSLQDGSDLFSPLTNTTSPPLAVGQNLYMGTPGALSVFNGYTGQLINHIEVPSDVVTRPAAANGKIVAGTESGHLLVINP